MATLPRSHRAPVTPGAISGVQRPSPATLSRLLARGHREQWQLDDLDWRALSVDPLPAFTRVAASDLFVQVRYAELAALASASRLHAHLSGPARDLCAMQIHDEQRHTAFFTRLIQVLEVEAPLRASVQELMDEVRDAPSIEACVLGMQVFVESAAHFLFLRGAQAFAELASPLPPELVSVTMLVEEWLPRRIALDERRHIVLGTTWLRERIPNLSAHELDQLERQVARWGALVARMAESPEALDGAGLDGGALGRECLQSLDLRLAQTGLQTRLPSLCPVYP